MLLLRDLKLEEGIYKCVQGSLQLLRFDSNELHYAKNRSIYKEAFL